MTKVKKTIKNIKKKNKTLKGGSFISTSRDFEIFYPRKSLGKLLPSRYATTNIQDAPTIEWDEIFEIPNIRFKYNKNYLIYAYLKGGDKVERNIFIIQKIKKTLFTNINIIKNIDKNDIDIIAKSITFTEVKLPLIFKIYDLKDYNKKISYNDLIVEKSTYSSYYFNNYNKNNKKKIKITKDKLNDEYYFNVLYKKK